MPAGRQAAADAIMWNYTSPRPMLESWQDVPWGQQWGRAPMSVTGSYNYQRSDAQLISQDHHSIDKSNRGISQLGDNGERGGRRRGRESRRQAARGGGGVPAAGPRHPGDAPRAAAGGEGLRRDVRQHGGRARPDGARARGRPGRVRPLRRGARVVHGDGRAVRAGERRPPRGVRPVAAPRRLHGRAAPRALRARGGAAPPRRRGPGHDVPRRRHLLRVAGDAGQEARHRVRVLLDGARSHLQPLLPRRPAHQERPLQMQRSSEGHDHVHPGRAGDRAVRAHVVPAGDGHHHRGAPHHLQGVRGGPRRRLRAGQHRGGAGAVHHRRAPRREALLRRGPHPPGGLRAQRRGHLHVGRVRLLPLARRAAARVRALHLLRQLRARDQAGAARDRGGRPGQRCEVPVGDAAGHRELRRPGPAPRGVRGCGGRARGGGAVVLPGGGAVPRRGGGLPDALRVELRPGERVGGGAHAVLPAAHRPVHQPAARRAGVARRRARRGPRRGVRQRGEGEDRGGDVGEGGGGAPGGGEEGEEDARRRRGARRIVAEGLRRVHRHADAPMRRTLSRAGRSAGRTRCLRAGSGRGK